MGQRIVVVPPEAVRAGTVRPLLASLAVTAAGHFPRARLHQVERPTGVPDVVVIYCTRGKGWANVRGRPHLISEGEVVVLPPDEPHAYGAAPDAEGGWTIYWLHARGRSVVDLCDLVDASPQRPTMRVGDTHDLAAAFERLIGQLMHGYDHRAMMTASLMAADLFSTLVAARADAARHVRSPTERTRETIVYLREQLSASCVDVRSLAALAHLSHSHYSSLFKRETGYAPIDYFLRLRLHEACRQLDTTTRPISEIAAAVGFVDAHYFSRQFKRVLGQSPRAYRCSAKG